MFKRFKVKNLRIFLKDNLFILKKFLKECNLLKKKEFKTVHGVYPDYTVVLIELVKSYDTDSLYSHSIEGAVDSLDKAYFDKYDQIFFEFNLNYVGDYDIDYYYNILLDLKNDIISIPVEFVKKFRIYFKEEKNEN